MTAIMQGRLIPPSGERIQSFPAGRWAEEFPLAARAGLDAIEWIDDIDDEFDDADNPLWSDAGVEQIRALAEAHGIAVRSICADSLMRARLAAGPARERAVASERLHRLLQRAHLLGVSRVVLPFVDSSSILDADARAAAVRVIAAAEPTARAAGVELHLEADLGPAAFAALLDELPDDLVRVNYDSGNSASLGYRPADELAAYGPRLGSVHVKDRVLGGTTVPLGTGDAKLDELFGLLVALDYTGPVVLQAARGPSGDELATVTAQRETVDALWEKARSAHNPRSSA